MRQKKSTVQLKQRDQKLINKQQPMLESHHKGCSILPAGVSLRIMMVVGDFPQWCQCSQLLQCFDTVGWVKRNLWHLFHDLHSRSYVNHCVCVLSGVE